MVWQSAPLDARDAGTFDLGKDVQSLFAKHPDNTGLVKLSYWFIP